MNRRSIIKTGVAGVAAIVTPGWLTGLAATTDGSTNAATNLTTSNNLVANPATVLPAIAGKLILGAQSYSFRDRSLDEMLSAMKELGLNSCELFELHVVPADLFGKRETLMEWRKSVKKDHFEMIRDKFDKHKINIQAYAANFKDNVTDEELESIFSAAGFLGTDILTTSATVSVMKRVDPFARKHRVRVGMHNHDHTERPNEFSNPDSFVRGMEGNSDLIRINLDIGHATAAGYDPLLFLQQMHEKILCIHVKDRKKDHGPRTRFGEGDTPIAAVLREIRDKNWPIPANIELEYAGDTITEMKRCVDYCRKAMEI